MSSALGFSTGCTDTLLRMSLIILEKNMKKWGGYLFFFGVGSMVLSFINMEFILLSWIDTWGPSIGWTIRIAMAVLGAAMWLVGNSRETASA